MLVDTGEFAALRADVAALTERVGRLAERQIPLEVAFRAGVEAGRESMLGRAARTSRAPGPRGPRPSHLRPVGGEPGAS